MKTDLDTVGPLIALFGLFFIVCFIICAYNCCKAKQNKKNLEGEYEPYMTNSKDPNESMNIKNGLKVQPSSVPTKSLETSPPAKFPPMSTQCNPPKHQNESVQK